MRVFSKPALAAVAMSVLLAPHAAISLDLGVSVGVGGIGADAGVSVGGGGGAGIVDADVSVGLGHALSGSVDATIGSGTNQGTLAAGSLTLGSASKRKLGAAVEIGLVDRADPSTSKAIAVSAPAVAIGSEDRRPQSAAERLVGVIVLSSDRKPLGIVQNIVARPDGYHVTIRLLETVGQPGKLVQVTLRDLPKRDDAVRLGITYATFVDRI